MKVRANRFLLGAAAFGAVVITSPAVAAPEQRQEYHLEEQNLGAALRAVGRASGREIVFVAGDVARKRASRLDGIFTPEEAVERLLSGSGLKATVWDGSILIEGRDTAQESEAASNDTGIVVTGTRIRGASPASPVIVVTDKQMRDSGHSNLGEVVRSLSQNFNGGQNPGIGSSAGGAQNENLNGSSAVNLRGLGPDATLTLLNGHRMAYGGSRQSVDISAIPLAAVERIEIVADGASALYGSDAVGGVANVIVKRDYQGLSTSARWGASTDGGNVQQQYGLVGGAVWESGGFITTYGYENDTPILARQRNYTSALNPDQTLVRGQSHHSVLLSGHQDLGTDLTFSIDGLYSRRVSRYVRPYSATAAYTQSGIAGSARAETAAAAPVLRWQPGAWDITLTGLYAIDRTRYGSDVYVQGNIAAQTRGCYCNRATSVELSAEGPVLRLPAGDVRLAVGTGYRRNRLHAFRTAGAPQDISASQESRFGYAELFVPFAAPERDIPFLRRLSLTAAVRYEDYRNADRLATPKLGVVYSPSEDLDLKASWGKSFKTPTLNQLHSAHYAELDVATYFGGTGFPRGSTAIVRSGGNPALKAERATSWTASLSAHPVSMPGVQLEISYFNVRYKDRVVQPVASYSSALSSPFYEALVTLDPSGAEIADALEGASLFNYTGLPLDPATVVAVIDNRYLNVARQKLQGVDILASYRIDLAPSETLMANANASYLESAQQLSDEQPVQSLAGTIFNPPRFRIRAGLTWEADDLTLAAVVNRISGVSDRRREPDVHVGGMTSVDLVAHYRVLEGSAAFSGLELGLSVQNVLNEKPAIIRTTSATAEPYDSTNYSAIGRFVSLSINRKW